MSRAWLRHRTARITGSCSADESHDLRDENVLDLGTGSGILASITPPRGPEDYAGDTISMPSSHEKNLTLNEARNVDAVCADLRDIRGTFDIVLANLDINTFTRHSRDVAGFVKKVVYMVVSGILGRDRKRLVAFFPYSTLITMEQKNAWRGFLFKHETPVS